MLHIYLSMAGFSVLLFFAVTGLTLNHQAALTGEPKGTRVTGTMDAALLPASGDVAIDAIVRRLRADLHVTAALGDVRVDDDQVSVSFKGPGYAADAFIDRRTGAYEMNESRLGFVAVINDLHKGRDTGRAWRQVIDLSAVLMALVSLTGLVLVFFLQKRLASGLAVLAGGTLAGLAVYWIWVA